MTAYSLHQQSEPTARSARHLKISIYMRLIPTGRYNGGSLLEMTNPLRLLVPMTLSISGREEAQVLSVRPKTF